MKPVILLRIASVFTLIHAIFHTIGGVFGNPVPGTAAMVAATMQANRFTVFGVTRSYADFYFGMGMGITIELAAQAILLWQLSTLAKKDPMVLRPIIAVLAAGYLALAVNSYRYFFQGPVIAEVLIALCLGLAILVMKRAETLMAPQMTTQG